MITAEKTPAGNNQGFVGCAAPTMNPLPVPTEGRDCMVRRGSPQVVRRSSPQTPSVSRVSN